MKKRHISGSGVTITLASPTLTKTTVRPYRSTVTGSTPTTLAKTRMEVMYFGRKVLMPSSRRRTRTKPRCRSRLLSLAVQGENAYTSHVGTEAGVKSMNGPAHFRGVVECRRPRTVGAALGTGGAASRW